MDELKDKKLQEKIKHHFEKMSYFNKYNFDIIITILAILFVLFVVIYFYISSRINLEKINWDKNKCNPFYMLFAESVNNGEEGFNRNNLNNCLNDLTSNIAHDILAPINAIANLFSKTLSILAGLFANMLDYFMHLYNLVVSLFRQLMLILQKIVEANSVIFSQINNFIGSVLGFITIIYYKIVLLVDSIKLIFPIMALGFLIGMILPTLLATVIAIIIFCVHYAIGSMLSPVFCIGCWAWAPVAVWLLVSIFLTIFLTFLTFVYRIFANACAEILQRTLAPISNNDNPMIFEQAPSV